MMKDIEPPIESSNILLITSFACAAFTIGWYYTKRYSAHFFSNYSSPFRQCTVVELKELKTAFNEYHRVSAKQYQEIKIIREAISTLRAEIEYEKKSIELSSEADSCNKLIELNCTKLFTISSLLSEYPVLSDDVKNANEIAKLRIEREKYHEEVKLAFEDYLKDTYSLMRSLKVETEGLSVASVGNIK